MIDLSTSKPTPLLLLEKNVSTQSYTYLAIRVSDEYVCYVEAVVEHACASYSHHHAAIASKRWKRENEKAAAQVSDKEG